MGGLAADITTPTGAEAARLHELLSQFMVLLKQLEETLHPTPPPKLAAVAGEGRGSKRPKAKLKSA